MNHVTSFRRVVVAGVFAIAAFAIACSSSAQTSSWSNVTTNLASYAVAPPNQQREWHFWSGSSLNVSTYQYVAQGSYSFGLLSLSTSTNIAGQGVQIGVSVGSTGVLNLASGSRLISSSYCYVGSSGYGFLAATNSFIDLGSSMDVAAGSSSYGLLYLDNSVCSQYLGGFQTSYGYSSTSRVLVANGSKLIVNGEAYVGRRGLGVIDVSNALFQLNSKFWASYESGGRTVVNLHSATQTVAAELNLPGSSGGSADVTVNAMS